MGGLAALLALVVAHVLGQVERVLHQPQHAMHEEKCGNQQNHQQVERNFDTVRWLDDQHITFVGAGHERKRDRDNQDEKQSDQKSQGFFRSSESLYWLTALRLSLTSGISMEMSLDESCCKVARAVRDEESCVLK